MANHGDQSKIPCTGIPGNGGSAAKRGVLSSQWIRKMCVHVLVVFDYQ